MPREPISLRLHFRRGAGALTARQSLENVVNGWLPKASIEEAKRVARKGTDAECEALLTRLERVATAARDAWMDEAEGT